MTVSESIDASHGHAEARPMWAEVDKSRKAPKRVR